MKKLLVILMLLTTIFAISSCTTAATSDKTVPPDLLGEWKQTNNQSEESYHSATISGDVIEIYWDSSDGETKALYWTGSFIAPSTADEPYTWDSVNDREKTDNALLASSDDTKTFMYQNGVLSYEASALGVTTTVKLEKSK